jgi:uroporphyrinogen decarboxylase
MWSKRQRMDAVLAGELADRPPVSGWRHFTDFEHGTPELFVGKMMEFQNTYDWDYIKLQPRASYYPEAWGAEFDYTAYNNGVSAPCVKPVVKSVDELDKIVELTGREPIFEEQIETVRQAVALAGETPVFHTIFCPTGVLQKCCGQVAIGRYREATREDPLVTLLNQHSDQVHKALKNIANSLAKYCRELVNAGAYGVFYAALGMARTGYLTNEEWEEFVKPYDMIVLEALKPSKTMLHTCGIYANPERFVDMPISILHWAESAPGNPTLRSAPDWINGVTPMGGVDERLFGQNKADEIYEAAVTTIHRMKKIPFVLGPDCSLSIRTTDEELKAFRRSVEEA